MKIWKFYSLEICEILTKIRKLVSPYESTIRLVTAKLIERIEMALTIFDDDNMKTNISQNEVYIFEGILI